MNMTDLDSSSRMLLFVTNNSISGFQRRGIFQELHEPMIDSDRGGIMKEGLKRLRLLGFGISCTEFGPNRGRDLLIGVTFVASSL